MSTGIEEPDIPYWLCQYCKNVTRQLTVALEERVDCVFRIKHYPNMQAFINGILERRCLLCGVFAGGIAKHHGLRTVEKVLEKLDEYHHKADCPLFMEVPLGFDDIIIGDDSEQCSEPSPLEPVFITLRYDKDNLTSENVTSLCLRYNRWDRPDIRKKVVSQELLSAFTGSDQSFALIKSWLSECYTKHYVCCSTSMQFAPTRLLDLGTRDTDDIRLVSGSSIGHVSYAALSYCWGSVPQLVLTSENQSEFQRRIPFESLSRVAQDAATVCRGVSMRYLWIDAICIMQGSDGDFHQEAALMEEVYAGALFTVRAGTSADTTQPFLVRRDPLWWTQCHLIDESRTSLGFIGADYCELSNDVPGKFELDSRGWCFQEQFLSPRSIYFGPRGVHWVCRLGTVCDRYPVFKGLRGIKDHDDDRWESPKQLYDRIVSLGDDISETETNLELCRVWGDIRANYSSKQLRYQSDKLLALAGVASVIQRKFNARASFGLWLETFYEDLLWVVHSFSGKGKRLDIAPSWSWANLGSCRISITVPYVPETGYRLLNLVLATIISLPPVTGFAIPLQDAGYRCHTFIRLSGRLTACVQHHKWSRRLDPKDFPPASVQKYGEYFPDTGLEEENLYCFLLKRYIDVAMDPETGEDLNRGEIRDCCLVLTPVPGSGYRFRRTGTYFEHSDWDENRSIARSAGHPPLHPHMFRGEDKELKIEII
ncbi:unnamed protein product [Alternaria alternata]